MAINLQKGQRENINAPKFTIGLGWDVNNTSTGGAFDLDASLFLLNDSKKLVSDNHFIFYNNLESPDKAVIHSGDNLTGDGDGDDEQIKIDLTKIDAAVQEITVVVTIHDADARRQNFGQVRNSFIRIFNTETNEEILKYELDEDFSIETAVEFGRIYNRNGEWKFEAVGSGQRDGLDKFVSMYQ
ncbi:MULTISPECIES: TerD family protein [Chryseobacterium]|jgi:tellurium resistance protein TerD|uniref:General stress protein 16U n=3 Tax=Chryseobacterium TaxID=59732 RepID=A0A381F913_9FLAO|nr:MULTISPECIES: TerD family protein [Chryseobacterium]AZA61134.1 TerD family protein [Chryseobacterium indoltheticum]AZA73221.1 TerD family protein [Chryseobacterium indoltheticum]AZB30634.1 TerD family protein [Chryseobacterium balustinum]MDF2831158.1 TerD family protein [Chryseobacterium indoltheticum]MDQ8142747.1 TerD family protein [Chryseobacterium sp. CFS15]